MPQRIVIDTSVFISALIGPSGPARELIRLCFQGKWTPVMGNALFSEYEAVRRRPEILQRCALSEEEIAALSASFYSVSEWMSIHYLWRPNLPDEADNHVIELALSAGAACIATNNLTDFRRAELHFPGLLIASPAELLKGH